EALWVRPAQGTRASAWRCAPGRFSGSDHGSRARAAARRDAGGAGAPDRTAGGGARVLDLPARRRGRKAHPARQWGVSSRGRGPGGGGGGRLARGEGITGFAVECLRRVSVAAGGRDPRNKPVPGIGEEQYPVFLAVPLLGDGRAEGALVVQRAERTFAPAEVTL